MKPNVCKAPCLFHHRKPAVKTQLAMQLPIASSMLCIKHITRVALAWVLGKEFYWGKHALKAFPAHLALIEPEGQYFVHVGSQGIRQCVKQGAAHKRCQHCQEQAAENIFTACSATAANRLTSVHLTRLEVGMWCSNR
jgi:hypothetical protein